MTCLSTDRNTQLQERLTKKLAQLDALYLAYEEALTVSRVESYTLDTGEARQTSKYRNPSELQKQIEYLENDIDALQRKLAGGGVVSIRFRR